MQTTHRVGIRVHAGATLEPGVRPADPAVAVLRRCYRIAVGPGVHEHQIHIGDTAFGQSGNDIWVYTQQLVAFDELVDGEVGLHAGNVFERADPLVGERHRT